MKTSITKPANRNARRGLTLIELLIVMVILAALAGILVPMLAGTITKAHGTSAATNMSELAKSIQTYQATYLGYPSNFDSLTDSNGAYVGYLLGNTGPDLIAPATSTAYTALINAGIKSLIPMVQSGTGDFSPTFYPYGNTASNTPTGGTTPLTPITIDGTTKLPQISGVAAAREFGAPAGATYVIFGIGPFTSMQGTTMLEAPVHFDDDPAGSPTIAYARFGAVFQITDASGNALNNAKLIGVCDFSSSGINNINDHLNDYWSANK